MTLQLIPMPDMLREHFLIFEDTVFINSCSKGALSAHVRAAYNQYLDDWQTMGSPWELWVSQLEILRTYFANLIHATSDEVAIKTSVSECVNALASSLDFSGERNKIVVDDFAFPTTAQIWHAQAPRGAQIVHVPEADNTTIPLEYYERVIDDQTLLVSLTHVCYRNGARQDIAEIAKIAHQHGALVLVDSYQALGTFPIDVKALGVDFLVGGALKYLLGSSGLAYLYVNAPHIPKLLPTVSGWFAQDNIFAMNIYENSPSHSARRFESGTPPNPNVYAAKAGLELIEEIGTDKIEAHLSDLTGTIKRWAAEEGYSVKTPDLHGAMIAIRSNDAEKLVGQLAQEKIIVSSRDGNIRISPHFYNNHSDINALFKAFARHDYWLA